jgi:hypothetical protein
MGFMISVDGMRAPKKTHHEFDTAFIEAVRIAQAQPLDTVRVLQEVMVIALQSQPLDFSKMRVIPQMPVTLRVGTVIDVFHNKVI